MGSTYSKVILHLVFSTKRRDMLITPELQPRLIEYVGGIVRGEGGSLWAMGGMPDHVHMLVQWRTDATIAALMRVVKCNSSLWVHETFPRMAAFGWQEGYGVFSVSMSNVEQVTHYIANQAEHHRTRDFRSEYLALLDAHGVEYDPRYVLD